MVMLVAPVLIATVIGAGRLARPSGPPGARAVATTSSTVVLHWRPPTSAVTAEIYRDGRLVDTVAAARASFRDAMLWPNQTYLYAVHLLDGRGKLLLLKTAAAHTPNGAAFRLFSANSPWNTPIGRSPAVDPNSALIVSHALVAYSKTASLANSKAWGVPIVVVSETSDVYDIKCSRFGCRRQVVSHIAGTAVPSTGSDHRLVLINPSTQVETDLWKAEFDPVDKTWSAGSRYQTSVAGAGTRCAAGQRCQGAVASGFAAAAGVVRPEEIAQGHIDHALSLASPLVRAHTVVCPATHTDGRSLDAGSIPEGARLQLDPSFNVDAQKWPTWKKVVAKALQKYGAYVTDRSDSLLVRGESMLNRGYNAWGLAGVPSRPGLGKLPWNRMRVLQMREC